MRRRTVLALIATLGIVAGIRSSADACDLAIPEPFVFDPAEQAVDVEPPGAPSATVTVSRRFGPTSAGCGKTARSSCDPLGSIVLEVAATDDRTAADDLGFRTTATAGSLPEGMSLPAAAIEARGGLLVFTFVDEPPDDQPPLDFVLQVRAVDRGGNEGPPTTVVVRHPGDE